MCKSNCIDRNDFAGATSSDVGKSAINRDTVEKIEDDERGLTGETTIIVVCQSSSLSLKFDLNVCVVKARCTKNRKDN